MLVPVPVVCNLTEISEHADLIALTNLFYWLCINFELRKSNKKQFFRIIFDFNQHKALIKLQVYVNSKGMNNNHFLSDWRY